MGIGRRCGRRRRSRTSGREKEIRRKLGKERRGKEGKNTFELSRTTGGRKERISLGRWLCLCLPFLVNRGFGKRTSNWARLASAHCEMRCAHSPVPVCYCFLLSRPSQVPSALSLPALFYQRTPCRLRVPPRLLSVHKLYSFWLDRCYL